MLFLSTAELAQGRGGGREAANWFSPELSDGCRTSWWLRPGSGKSWRGGREGFVVLL